MLWPGPAVNSVPHWPKQKNYNVEQLARVAEFDYFAIRSGNQNVTQIQESEFSPVGAIELTHRKYSISFDSAILIKIKIGTKKSEVPK